MFDMLQIGKKISYLRKKNNLTQMELADFLEISFQAVSNWERGNSAPDISKLPELASLFHVTVDEILGESNTIINSIVNQNPLNSSELATIHPSELIDAVPFIKPSQTDCFFDQIESRLTPSELVTIAPFVSTEILDKIAVKIADSEGIEKLCVIAPFISKCVLDNIAIKVADANGVDKLCSIAPFISKEVLDSVAVKAINSGGIDQLYGIAPFISKDLWNNLAMKTASNIEGNSTN